MTAAPAKFRFDLDLGHRQERNSVITARALAAMISNARALGYYDGLADGERAAIGKAAERMARSAEVLADHVASMSAALDDHRRQTLTEAVDLAATVGKKLASNLLAAEPTREIEALLVDCLASLDSVPHLVIRCSPELADAVREIATTRIATSGFTGRLVVLGDPAHGPGDARLEWVDGGVARDRTVLEAEIDRRVATYIAAHGGTSTARPGGTEE